MGKKFPFQTGYEPQHIFEKDGVMWSTRPGSIGYLIGSNGVIIGRRGKPMVGNNDTKGYPMVVMFDKHNKPKTPKRHRLVAEAFLLNPLNKPQVNHKDGDKENNDISNLEWATNSENHAHKMEMGLNVSPGGERHGMAILTEEEACCIYMDERPRKLIAEEYGVSLATVHSIKGKRNWNYITKGLDAIGYSVI